MLVASTALLGAVCGAAQAAPAIDAPASVTPAAAKPLDFTVHADSSSAIPGGQTVKWDAAKGRWGLTFNMRQLETRDTTLNDIQAGAYYKITPAWRMGGAFSFGSEQISPGPKPITPDVTQPRVQLETKFKF
jgi:uncharacterized protein with beta-barrel porin domain